MIATSLVSLDSLLLMYFTTNKIVVFFANGTKAYACLLNKSARYARRDKHTPCIKTNRLKRQNRSRAKRAVRAKPLGESGPFFSHIGNAIFCPLFHRRIFSFFISTGEFCFCLFGVGITAWVYLNMRFPIQIPTQHSFF